MIYSSFEQLPIWQDARLLVSQVYALTEKQFKRDFELKNQFRRAALSISLNIAEGFERKTNKDFARFINMAKGSAGECRTILYIAKDLGYIEKIIFTQYLEKIIQISKQLSKFSDYLIKSADSH